MVARKLDAMAPTVKEDLVKEMTASTMRSTCELERRERDLNPRPRDSGFRIHRNTGLCDLGSILRLLRHRHKHDVWSGCHGRRFHGRDVNTTVQVEPGTTVRKALEQANVLPSMVIVKHEGTVLSSLNAASTGGGIARLTISSGG